MSKLAALRFGPMSSRWLLVANAVVFVINVACLSVWAFGSRSAQHGSAGDSYWAGKLLGMDVGWKTGPLMLLLDKGFPRKDSFALCDESQRLILSGGDADEADASATKRAGIALGIDFEVQCFYSLGQEIAVQELWLTKEDDTLIDLNADGIFDVRVHITPERPGLVQVMYGGQWLDTVDGIKLRKQLRDGGEVEFDLQSGRWLPLTDVPDTTKHAEP